MWLWILHEPPYVWEQKRCAWYIDVLKKEMPARIEEVERAEEEGVNCIILTNPVRFLGNENGWVTGIECIKWNWESRMSREEGGLFPFLFRICYSY